MLSCTDKYLSLSHLKKPTVKGNYAVFTCHEGKKHTLSSYKRL